MELFDNLALGFGVAFTFQNLIYAFVGCLLGTLIGVAWGGSCGHHCHAVARHLRIASCGGFDHVGRHLLWCAIRWLHDGDLGEPTGRSFFRGDHD